MREKHFILSYYKNADSGIHIQKITDSAEAQKTHSHEYFQIYYVLQGSLVHITENTSSRLVKGDAFIVPPNCRHSIGEIKNAVFYTLSFTKESIESDKRSLLLIFRFFKDLELDGNLQAKIPIKSDQLLLAESLLEKLNLEFYEKQIGYGDVVRSYLIVLLTILARAHFENAPLTIPDADTRGRIASCLEYIDSNLSDSLTLSDMAKWCAMSKSEFCKQFLLVSGTTFGTYLHRARIHRATKLIRENYNIGTLYSLCGYNDFSTFYRNFKKIMGCSPSQYQKNAF